MVRTEVALGFPSITILPGTRSRNYNYNTPLSHTHYMPTELPTKVTGFVLTLEHHTAWHPQKAQHVYTTSPLSTQPK